MEKAARGPFFGGWIMVQAEVFSVSGIITALKEGKFYSSMGPEIYSLLFEENKIIINCSNVNRINFITQKKRGFSSFMHDGSEIQSAEYQLKGWEKYIRIECIDNSGRTAWTNPIFFDK